MAQRIEETHIDENGKRQTVRRWMSDPPAEAQRKAEWAAQIIWVAFGLLIGGLGIRFMLKLIAANPANAFTSLVYSATGLFMAPFENITASPSAANGMIFEFPVVIAMLVYALIGWALERIIRLVIKRTRS
jgi:hypothetical protein